MTKYVFAACVLASSLSSATCARGAPPLRLPATEDQRIEASQSRHMRRVAFEQPAEAPEPLPAGEVYRDGAKLLSLADLEQMALIGNPSIARARALTNAARGTWTQVGLPPNPSSGYQGQQIGSAGRAEQDGAYVEQEIVRGGKLRLNRAVAAQEINRLEQELSAQRQRVLNDVAISYFGVLIAERQERLTVSLLEVAERNVKAADALFKGKEVGQVDVLQAELEYENASILVQNAKNRRAATWQNLATTIGQPRLEPQPVAGDPEDDHAHIAYDSVRDRLLTASPEIAASVANVERARWALERARVEAVPNVTVQGLVNWRDNGIGGASDGALTVGLPIPAWNRNQGGIMQAQNEVAAAERGLEQLELSLQNRLAPVYERYANSQNQVRKYRQKILPAANKTLELTRKMYSVGETGYITLLTAQRTYSQTNLNYLDALRELRASEVELEGMLLRGSLDVR